ncbi:DUF6893 family small protein [Streptomyces spongiae]|nr:hypothetical protein [Streptomyces spongiae]
MRKRGLLIPSNIVRASVGAFTAVLVLVALTELPEMRRYLKLKSM